MKEEVFIPYPLSEQLEEAAAEQKVTVDEFAENAIRKFLRSENNGR